MIKQSIDKLLPINNATNIMVVYIIILPTVITLNTLIRGSQLGAIGLPRKTIRC